MLSTLKALHYDYLPRLGASDVYKDEYTNTPTQNRNPNYSDIWPQVEPGTHLAC